MADKKKKGSDDARQKRLDSCLADVEKKFGKGSVVRFDKKESLSEKLHGYSTGIIGVDAMTGCNGIPKGRVTEISGLPSCGKTTVVLQTIAHAQLEGEKAAFIDFEQALDPRYARTLGVNVNDMLVSQPDYGEQGLEIVMKFLESRAVGIIVVDSVGNLVPRADVEGEVGDATWAGRARLLTQALAQQLPLCRRNDVSLIYLNQIRANMNAMQFGPKTQTPGGYKLRHDAGLRLEFTRIQQLKDGSRVVGGRTRAKAIKNKVGGFPYATAEFDLFYGSGTSLEYEIFDYGVKFGLLKKVTKKDKGSWFEYNGQVIGTGREKCRQFMRAHPDLSLEIEKLVRAELEIEYAKLALDDTTEEKDDDSGAKSKAPEEGEAE